MKRTIRWAGAVAAGLSLLLLAAGRSDATSAIAKAEGKPCSFCHAGKVSDNVFTEAGKHYAAHRTLKGFGEEAKAPEKADASAGAAATPPGEPTPAPARPAAMAAAEPGCPCGCGCPHCPDTPGGPHGPMKGAGMKPPDPESMKGHVEEMRKTLSALRESEKALEGSVGSDPFRAAVLDHLRKLDDLQAAHLGHMETMMGRMRQAKERIPCGKDCPHGCREGHGCDCPCDCPCGGTQR